VKLAAPTLNAGVASITPIGGIMDNRNTTTTEDTGPGMALSALYEANDLLTLLREHGNENPDVLGAAQWTLTTEISRRLNTAIAALDETGRTLQTTTKAGAA
jgi:hypothetical protein